VQDRYYEIMKQQKKRVVRIPEIDVGHLEQLPQAEGIERPRASAGLDSCPDVPGYLRKRLQLYPDAKRVLMTAPHLSHGSCFRRAALLCPAGD
jgi:hypothetical protein